MTADPEIGTVYFRAQDLVQAGLLHKGSKSVFCAAEPDTHAYAVVSSKAFLASCNSTFMLHKVVQKMILLKQEAQNINRKTWEDCFRRTGDIC